MPVAGMLLVRFWPSYRRDIAEIMKILSLEIAHEIDRDIRQAQARKRENTKTFGRRHTRVTRHMIISPFCHFQAPWRLEQSVYAHTTLLILSPLLHKTMALVHPRRRRPVLALWDAVHKRHLTHTPCGILILNASLCAAAWAI